MASPVPVITGVALEVRLSVAEMPVSLAASCFRPMLAVMVWSSVNELVPGTEMLPAASVAITFSVTRPSTNPVAGSDPVVGAAVLVLMDQLPDESATAV